MKGARSVLATFRATTDKTPDATAIWAVDPAGATAILTYRELHDAASRVGQGFLRLGVKRGERVIISMPTCGEFFWVYLGCLMAGIIPAVVAHARVAGAAGCSEFSSLAQTLDARCLVVREVRPDSEMSDRGLSVVAARSLLASRGIDRADEADGIAHLQGTSGTTTAPRWAVLRHRNIAANVSAIGRAVGHREEDVLVTWLPMSHDMGLIGVSYAWYWGIPLVSADPGTFVGNPLSWLALISQYGGTLSPAPNSAFQVCVRVAKLRPPKDLDLSSWRVALCGAEPVHEATLRDFHQTFGRFGLRREVLTPVYGLAEATLAVTLSPARQPFRTERINPASCAPGASVVASTGRGLGEVAIVGCGRVIAEHELRIVDGAGHPVAEGVVGEIEFRGDSVVDSYFGIDPNPGLKRGEFLRTGDLGYLRDGELFVTGRSKEILIINGRNFSPLQIEAALEQALAAPFTPAVVAVEAADEQLKSGALHLLVDSRLGGGDRAAARARQTLEEVFGLRGATLHWVAGGHIPRTSSGKIQRLRCREIVTALRRTKAAAAPVSQESGSA
jgi:fatty-acyl-CoA synthase